MARYGNGKYVSLTEEADDDPLLQMFCRSVSQLFCHPMKNNTSIGLRFTDKFITSQVTYVATAMSDDVNLCARQLRGVASVLMQIPLAAITHAFIERMRKMNRNVKVIHETTLELFQYASILLESAVPYHKLFVGDCHSCTLYCEKCHRPFSEKGNIFKILAEAPTAILYHHGLELTESNSQLEDGNEGLKQMLWKDGFSCPFPCTPFHTFLGQFSLTIIDKQDKSGTIQRCRFGTGDHVSKNDHDHNIKYLHSLNEAMKIDTFFVGNEDILQKCLNFTSALLLALFDCAHHRPGNNIDPSELGHDVEGTTFDEFASKVATAEQQGEEWIQSNCTDDLMNQHHVLLGWCILVLRQFLFNYTYPKESMPEPVRTKCLPSLSMIYFPKLDLSIALHCLKVVTNMTWYFSLC